MVSLEQEGNIFTLYIPIAFTPEVVTEIHSKLDQVEAHDGPTALIFASKHPTIFNAGMNLKYISKVGGEETLRLFQQLMKLMGRMLSFSVPTVCAINGHAAAGGVMFALAADYRIMRNDKGTMKLTEIGLGMTLPRGGNIVLKAKLSPTVHRDMLLRGLTFSPQDCLEKGVVDGLVSSSEVLGEAKKLGQELADFGEKKDVYRLLKGTTYGEEIEIAKAAEVPDEEMKIAAIRAPKL